MDLPLIHLGEVDSTQAFLARHPELGSCGVLADRQTAGRGRGGNRWESPAAGLWMSARLPAPGVPPGVLLQKAMVAVAEALAPCGVALGLKWPNDLVAWREGCLVKVGGILGEAARGQVILGVGVNLRQAPVLPDRAIPPAALVDLGVSCLPDPLSLARGVLRRWCALECTGEPTFRWPEAGDPLQWEEGAGLCRGWGGDGRLGVETSAGLQWLSVGDIRGARP